MITPTSMAFNFHKISIACGHFVVIFYKITYPKLFHQRMQFFSSHWHNFLWHLLWRVFLQTPPTRLQPRCYNDWWIKINRLLVKISIQCEEKNYILWRKQFWVSYFIKNDHKNLTNNWYLYKNFCSILESYHNVDSGWSQF